MKCSALRCALIGAVLASTPSGIKVHQDQGPASPLPGKKGVGLSSSYGATQLNALQAKWFYNWGASTPVTGSDAVFVPMVFSNSALNKLTGAPLGQVVLGFNEPDNPLESNLTVEAALKLWSQVTGQVSATGGQKTWVGAPGTSHDPTTTWLPQFMAASPQPRVDFVVLHWYKGPDFKQFVADVNAVHTKYGLPVWVTEFAPQTYASSMANPEKYTQQDITSFINAAVPWLESQSFVQAYAWHDSKYGLCSLYNADGSLSATGLAYAQAAPSLS